MNRHNAPPVAYPLGRSRFLGAVLFGVWLAGLLMLLLWHHQARLAGWPLISGMAAVLLAGLAAGSHWRNSPCGQLAWDGQCWRWESAAGGPDASAQALALIADFQGCLLLRLDDPAGTTLWLWAQQWDAPARWLDLRRAVHARRRPLAAEPAHGRPSAGPFPSASPAVSAVAVSGMASMAATPLEPKP